MASKPKLSKQRSQNQLSTSPPGKRSTKQKHVGHKEEEEKQTLAFKVLSAEDTKQLCQIEDVDELQEKMREVLKIEDPHLDLKAGSTLDYYVAGFWWAKEQQYTTEQTSAFFTVLHTLLENIKEKQLGCVENMTELKKMFSGVGIEMAEVTGGLDCFNVTQACSISQYLHQSLFQHHQMYEYMFNHTQAEEIIGTDLILETPKAADVPWPPSFEEGISEEIYHNFISSPCSTPAPQSSAASAAGDDAAEGAASSEAGAQTAEGDQDAKEEDEIKDTQREADLLAQLSTEEVTRIMDSVFEDMLGGLKDDVATKLREKENAFIARINKIHRVAEQ